MTDYETILLNTAKVWCPDYPRRVAGKMGAGWGQLSAHQPEELVHNLMEVRGEYPGYVSTYSFPKGHPTDNSSNIPRIDTLMLDFDVDKSKFMQDGELKRHKWAFHVNKLLDRLSSVAEALLNDGKGDYFRWSLSGFKGAHAYLDFPAISHDTGRAGQFENGMESFTDLVILKLKEITGYDDLEEYIDVCSGWDLARLTRLPNTVHEKATKHFDETKYCVPVTTEEMADMDPSKYVKMTREPRLPDEIKRVPRSKSAEMAKTHIKVSPFNGFNESTSEPSSSSSASVEEYKKNLVNERVNLRDVAFLLKRKPCIWEFRNHDRMFKEGNASHVMETQCILAMASIGTPIEVMHDFFKASDRYSEEFTQKRIRKVLSQDYKEFDCRTVLEDAPMFCLKDDGGPNRDGCKIYKGDKELQQKA